MSPQDPPPSKRPISQSLDFPWPLNPTPQDWADAILALPRADDFRPQVRPSAAQSPTLDWSDPDVWSAYLRPPGQLSDAHPEPDDFDGSQQGQRLRNLPQPSDSSSQAESRPGSAPPTGATHPEGASSAALPKDAVTYPLTWTDGVGVYRWEAPQVAVGADRSVSQTGRWGGAGVISTTNPHGIASTDAPDPQNRSARSHLL